MNDKIALYFGDDISDDKRPKLLWAAERIRIRWRELRAVPSQIEDRSDLRPTESNFSALVAQSLAEEYEYLWGYAVWDVALRRSVIGTARAAGMTPSEIALGISIDTIGCDAVSREEFLGRLERDAQKVRLWEQLYTISDGSVELEDKGGLTVLHAHVEMEADYTHTYLPGTEDEVREQYELVLRAFA